MSDTKPHSFFLDSKIFPATAVDPNGALQRSCINTYPLPAIRFKSAYLSQVMIDALVCIYRL